MNGTLLLRLISLLFARFREILYIAIYVYWNALCKMLPFRVKTIVRGSGNVELATLKKEEERRKEEKHFGRFSSFWFGTFTKLFRAARSLSHKNAQR